MLCIIANKARLRFIQSCKQIADLTLQAVFAMISSWNFSARDSHEILMQTHHYISTFLLLCMLAANAIAETGNTEEEYQRISTQLDGKKSNLNSIKADLAKQYKDIKELQDKVYDSKLKQRKLELKVKRLTVFDEKNAEQKEALQRAKYSLRFEQVKQQQLEADIAEKRDSIPALEEKKQRLEQTVTVLKKQQKTVYQSSEYQSELQEQAKKAQAAKLREAELERQKQAEIDRQLKAEEQAKKPQTKADKIYQQKLAKAKKDFIAKQPSPEKALKIRSLIATLQEQPLPADLKAITDAKMRALTPYDGEPYFGYLPKLQLKVEEQPARVIGYLHYLGNNQYMYSLKLQQGFQDFIIGKWRYSQQILPKYNNKRGVILVDASVEDKPIFSIYPANQKSVDLFSF